MSDITERKQAEEALRQSEEKYRTILEEMEDAYFEVDLGGHFTFVNNSVCRDLGYSREELIRMSYKRVTAEDDIESVFRVFNQAYRTSVPNKGFPWKTTRKDGSHGFAETSISLLRNEQGETIGFRGVGRDITERKKAEQELSKTQAQLSGAVQMAHLGPWEYDATNDMFTFNDAFYELFHTSAQEVGGYTMSSAEYARRFVHPEDAHLVAEEIRKAFQADDPNFSSQLDHRIIYADGEVGYICVRFFIVKDETGSTVRTYGVNQDITERKQAEEALRQSEERYRTILEEMEDAYFEVDLGGHLIFVNNSVCRDLGYSREELIGMSYKDFTIEDDIESLFRVFNEVYQTGVPNKGFPWKPIRKDGVQGFAETSVSPLRNNKGEIIGFRGVGRDVTERKQAEEKLRQSEEKYRALFDSSVIGTLVLDAKTMQVMMGNEAAMKIFGFSSLEEAAGVNVLDFVPKEDRELNLELIGRELFEKDSRQTYDVRAITKDGRKIWINVTGVRMTYQDRLVGMVTFTDVTERKWAEEALRQSEENYRALFDSSVIGTFVLDAETMRVAMANQAAVEMFRLSSPQEIRGADPLAFIHPEDREETLDLARKSLLEQDSHQTRNLRAITKDGREIWISATGAKIKHEGRLAGLISFTDITEQKRQNEQLMMADRLASIGELAAGAAHELNNPLTSVIGFSQLLIEKDIPDDIHQDVKFIYDEAQRAANVTKNLLTFARKHTTVKHINQINNVIEDVLKLRAYEHKVNNIEVKKGLAPDLPEIMVDYFLMQQAFFNIITNAEYFMTEAHKGGTLTITTKKKNGSTVMISIADDGPGIPQENLRRIFDPFFTTKEAGKGTGLGLSICHGIVTEHGGQIYARSQPGKGATIFVELRINGSNHVEAML
jgi:two-component system NtrC family sensor kinase